MQSFIKAVGAGKRRARNLERAEAREAMAALLSTEDDAQKGAFLLAMRMKGETSEELAGFVDALDASQSPPTTPACPPHAVDVDGHGDGRQGRPCLLIAAAALAASAGADVELRIDRQNPHAHHHLPEILDALGDALRPLPSLRVRRLEQDHPRLASLLALRQRVGVRTFIASVVKLWSPRRAPARVVGIFHSPYHEPMAGALALLGVRGFIVQAPGGLPEPPAETRGRLTAPQSPTERLELDGRSFGEADDTGGPPSITTALDAARLTAAVLAGERGWARKQALLAAAVLLVAAGLAPDFESGYKRAKAQIGALRPISG